MFTEPVVVELTADEEQLLKKLKKSAGQRLTSDERFERKVSFVYGNQPSSMNMTREEVARRLKEMA